MKETLQYKRNQSIAELSEVWDIMYNTYGADFTNYVSRSMFMSGDVTESDIIEWFKPTGGSPLFKAMAAQGIL